MYHFPLYEWDEIKKNFDPSALLIGNGASIAVWPAFGYNSLFDVAVNELPADMALSIADVMLFRDLGAQSEFFAV